MNRLWSSAIELMASPFRLAQLASGVKSFEANAIIGSRRLNDRGLHVARVSLSHGLAAARRRRLARFISAEDQLAFDRDGFIVKADFLPAEAFTALVDQIKAYHGRAWEAVQGDTIHRKMTFDSQARVAVPALAALTRSPAWRGLIRYVGGVDAEPMLFIQSLFRPGGEQSTDPQTHLHADTFHPTAKAWFFLTDVAEDAGPFVYVPGSHKLSPQRLAWERSMSLNARTSPDRETREGSFRIQGDDLARLGLGAPRAFPVKANTLLVADTFGFHARGPSLSPSQRVEIFALGRRDPFRLLEGTDLMNRVLLAAHSRWAWPSARAGARLGLRPTRARLRSGVSAFDPPIP